MKQTVTSKYEPKSKNVTWIDMSTGHPVQKNFINGMWRPTGGSGDGVGLSNPTEADVNKVWQVTPVLKGTKIEEITLAPQQMMKLDTEDLNSCILQNTSNLDKFVNGAKVIAVIDGTEYEGTVEQGKIGLGVLLQEEPQIDIMKVPAELSPTGEEVLRLLYQGEHEVSVNVVEETQIYDYNWAPGVKIPIPTAEDEGKILVVTKVDRNSSIIVPEQEVPVDPHTPLTDVDLTKFVVGNTVKVTITYEEEEGRGGKRGAKSANSQTITATGVIEEDEDGVVVSFNIDGNILVVWQEDNLLYTHAFSIFGDNSTIKLEYIESNYEYQLQENSGGDSSNNSGYAIKIPDNITLASPNSSSEELYCVYEHDNSSLEPGIYLAAYKYTVNGISFQNVYQIMINGLNTRLLGSFVVNISDGGNLKAQSYDVYPIYPNKGGYFINIVYDNIQSAYFINIEYGEGAQE